ncbi:MAG TPA: hypothetical protein VIN77_10960 [Aurantimonas sp.]
MVAAIETGVPTLTDAQDLIDRFQAMIRNHAVVDLDPWIANASHSLLASFVRGIQRRSGCRACSDNRSVVERSD